MCDKTDVFDLAVFAGQSNMSGRGDAASAVKCSINAGFEYKPVSRPEKLLPVSEPFGTGEERAGGICDINPDGSSKRTGSMVSALIDEYFRQCGRKIIGVCASVGGTSTAQWKEVYIKDAVSRLNAAKAFLKSKNIPISNIFVVWSQGETDGDNNVCAEEYIKNLKYLFNEFKICGAEKCFLIQTGHYNYIGYPHNGLEHDKKYEIIRDAQNTICSNDSDFVMTASFEPYIFQMKDQVHYNQNAYNAVGKTAGKAIAEFYKKWKGD